MHLSEFLSGDSNIEILRCPACRGDCLHHGHVEVFDRKEIAEASLRGTMPVGKDSFTFGQDGNPTDKRPWLLIRFWCEGCHRVSVLSIAQHKGCTQINLNLGREVRPDWPDIFLVRGA